MRPLLDQMHEMGLLDFRLPVAMRGEVSSIAPTAEFASRVRDLGITLADFGRDEREEVLVLTRRVGPRAVQRNGTHQLQGDLRDESAQGCRCAESMRSLPSADIEFIDDGLSPHVDPHEQTPEAPLCAALGRVCGEVRSRRTALRRLLE